MREVGETDGGREPGRAPRDPPGEPRPVGDSVHEELWGEVAPVVGVVHLLPLPGSPAWGGSMARVLDRAMADAELMTEGGLGGLLVENYGDAPFFPGRVPAETVAALAVVVKEVVGATRVPVGVNVLRNDAPGALAVAGAAGARFLRVNVHTGSMFTDQGLIQGEAHETLRKREHLRLSLSILADVLVKHASPPPGVTLEGAARDTWHRGLADGLILTGSETGTQVDASHVERLRRALPSEARIWVGSGVVPESAAAFLDATDGIIVGSSLQTGGRAGGGVEASRVQAFMRVLGRG